MSTAIIVLILLVLAGSYFFGRTAIKTAKSKGKLGVLLAIWGGILILVTVVGVVVFSRNNYGITYEHIIRGLAVGTVISGWAAKKVAQRWEKDAPSDIKIETSQVIEDKKPSVKIDFSHIPGDHKLTIKDAAQAIGVGQGVMKDYVKSGRVKVNPDNTIDVAEIRRAGFIIREMPTHKA